MLINRLYVQVPPSHSYTLLPQHLACKYVFGMVHTISLPLCLSASLYVRVCIDETQRNAFDRARLFKPKPLPTMAIASLSFGFCGFVVLANLSLLLNSVGFYQVRSNRCNAMQCNATQYNTGDRGIDAMPPPIDDITVTNQCLFDVHADHEGVDHTRYRHDSKQFLWSNICNDRKGVAGCDLCRWYECCACHVLGVAGALTNNNYHRLVRNSVAIATVTDFEVNLAGTIVALLAVVITSFYQVVCVQRVHSLCVPPGLAWLFAERLAVQWVGEYQKSLEANSMQLLYYQAPTSAVLILLIIPMFDDVWLLQEYEWSTEAVVCCTMYSECKSQRVSVSE
jgi:hypothetical protein